VRANPKDTILRTLVSVRAPCAARTIAGLLADDVAPRPALDALRALSGRGEWTAEQLTTWASGAARPPSSVHERAVHPPNQSD
jgi:hypothetical protein